jgi:hypothetical protein
VTRFIAKRKIGRKNTRNCATLPKRDGFIFSIYSDHRRPIEKECRNSNPFIIKRLDWVKIPTKKSSVATESEMKDKSLPNILKSNLLTRYILTVR